MLGLTVSQQLIIFLKSCLLGASLGVLYDVFRIFRIAVKAPAPVVVLEDILYFTLAGFFTFSFLLAVSNGQVRIYLLLGALLGFVLYYFTVGALVFKMSSAIINAVKAVLRFLFGFILRPIYKVCCFIYQKVNGFFVWITLKFKKRYEMQKILLQRKRVLLYNQKDKVTKEKDCLNDGRSKGKKKQKKQKHHS